MNYKIIVAMALVLMIAIPAFAATVKINNIDYTPAAEVRGGLAPDMIVSYNLPPYDTFFHVGTVTGSTVTVREGSITDANGTVLRAVPLDRTYFVSSPFYPTLPMSPP